MPALAGAGIPTTDEAPTMAHIVTHHDVIRPDYRTALRNAGIDEAGGRALPACSAEAPEPTRTHPDRPCRVAAFPLTAVSVDSARRARRAWPLNGIAHAARPRPSRTGRSLELACSNRSTNPSVRTTRRRRERHSGWIRRCDVRLR